MLNLLDIFCFCAFSLSLVFGVVSGSVKLVIGFIFFVLSIIRGYVIYFPFAEALSEYITSSFIINAISIPLSYTISALFCGLIAKYCKKNGRRY
ncbi:MAG UNVERIFIED_CONTAM: CvpA family protein [Rickettsiaceae bacterium]|jgi:uncharacterized membrane protein required for colicin V production